MPATVSTRVYKNISINNYTAVGILALSATGDFKGVLDLYEYGINIGLQEVFAFWSSSSTSGTIGANLRILYIKTKFYN